MSGSSALSSWGDGIRVSMRTGGVRFRPLLDTGSAQTWLPSLGCACPAPRGASTLGGTSRRFGALRLSGEGAGVCIPSGRNFSVRYADGSSVFGTLCTPPDALRIGSFRFAQEIGAGLRVVERWEHTADALYDGVLALSPARSSSLHAIFASIARDRKSGRKHGRKHDCEDGREDGRENDREDGRKSSTESCTERSTERSTESSTETSTETSSETSTETSSETNGGFQKTACGRKTSGRKKSDVYEKKRGRDYQMRMRPSRSISICQARRLYIGRPCPNRHPTHANTSVHQGGGW